MAAVKIVVKNVYKPAQALELAVDRGATVRSLKQLIERDFPEHPAVADQKLIFGGKICADGDALSAVLAQQVQSEDGDEDEVVAVVFHLLVASTMPKPGTPPTAAPVAVTSEAVEDDSAAVDSPRPGAERTAPSFADPDMFAPPTTAAPAAQLAQPAQTTQHELYRQMMLMQQQAMVLTQIQYLQQLQQQAANAAPAPPAAGFGGHFMPFMPFGHYMGGQMPHFPPHHGHGANAPAAGGAAPPAPGLAAMFGGAGVPVPQAAAAVPRGPPPMVVVMLREVLPLFEIRLALKMAFMLFLIGQDTPTDRVLMLGLLSFISYLHITGIFAKIYEVYQQHHRRDGAAEDAAAPEPANGEQPAAAGGAERAPGQGFSLMRLLRISSDRGMAQDVKYFVVGLLLSLVPAWQPQPLHGAAPAPRENVMPDAADIPLQGI